MKQGGLAALLGLAGFVFSNVSYGSARTQNAPAPRGTEETRDYIAQNAARLQSIGVISRELATELRGMNPTRAYFLVRELERIREAATEFLFLLPVSTVDGIAQLLENVDHGEFIRESVDAMVTEGLMQTSAVGFESAQSQSEFSKRFDDVLNYTLAAGTLILMRDCRRDLPPKN